MYGALIGVSMRLQGACQSILSSTMLNRIDLEEGRMLSFVGSTPASEPATQK